LAFGGADLGFFRDRPWLSLAFELGFSSLRQRRDPREKFCRMSGFVRVARGAAAARRLPASGDTRAP
jgi:hypothetical protein